MSDIMKFKTYLEKVGKNVRDLVLMMDEPISL